MFQPFYERLRLHDFHVGFNRFHAGIQWLIRIIDEEVVVPEQLHLKDNIHRPSTLQPFDGMILWTAAKAQWCSPADHDHAQTWRSEGRGKMFENSATTSGTSNPAELSHLVVTPESQWFPHF